MTDRYASRAHLDTTTLEHLADGTNEGLAAALDVTLAHLARRCPTCREVLEAYPRQRVLDRAKGGYATAVWRAQRRFLDLAGESDEAPRTIDELLSVPSLPQAFATLSANPRYATWSVAALLAGEATAQLEDDPHGSHRRALLATTAAERLPADAYTAGLRAAARALARTALASTRLVAQRDLAGARADLRRAATDSARAADPERVEVELGLTRMRIDLATHEWHGARIAFDPIEARASNAALPDRRACANLSWEGHTEEPASSTKPWGRSASSRALRRRAGISTGSVGGPGSPAAGEGRP